MKYTREQLVVAMQKYNTNFLNDETNFFGEVDTSRECAENQVDYLISQIE